MLSIPRGRPVFRIAAILLFNASIVLASGARVAIITPPAPSTGHTAEAIVALAQSDLSGDGDIEPVDRASIDKVLSEQALTAMGEIDAGSATRIGGLLRADVMAVVEPASGTSASEDAAVVIFDAATGLRLEDQLLPANVTLAARGVDDAIGRAVKKRAVGASNIRSVCILAVRNADLPRSMDSQCDAISLLLERALIHSPDLAVLERRRLEAVNKERSLPTKDTAGPLWPSLITIDLEISRHPIGGLRGVALLSANDGKPVGRADAIADDANPASLAEALSARVTEALRVAAAPAWPARPAEAQRFAAEADVLLRHTDYDAAARAAEAAAALAPDSESIQRELALCLLSQAAALLDPAGPGSSWNHFTPTVPPDDMLRSFAVFGRTVDLIYGLSPPTRQLKDRKANAYWDRFATFDPLLRAYLPKSLELSPLTAPEIRQAATDAHEAFRTAIRRRFSEWATLAGNPRALEDYTVDLRNLMMGHTLACDANSAVEYVAELTPLLQQWLDAIAANQRPEGQFDPKLSVVDTLAVLVDHHPQPMLRWQITEPQASQRLLAFASSLEKHPYPAVRLIGFGFSDSPQAYPDRVFQAIRGADPSPSGAMRRACYEAALLGIAAKSPEADPRLSDSSGSAGYRPLARFMLGRHEMVENVLFAATQLPDDASVVDRDAVFKMLDDAMAVLAQPDVQTFGEAHSYLQKEITRERDRLKKRLNDIDADEPVALWKSAREVLRARRNPCDVFDCAIVDGNSVYVVGSNWSEESKPLIIALRVPVDGGAPSVLGTAHESAPLHTRAGVNGCACIGDAMLFACDAQSGLLGFPLDKGEPIHLDANLPSLRISALAWLDGRVYAGMEDGYLVEVDPKTADCTVLASARRKEKQSPLDDRGPFTPQWMVSDAPRHRLIFFVQDLQVGKESRSGLWQLNSKDGAITPLITLKGLDDCIWGSGSRDEGVDLCLMNNSGHLVGLHYDLAHDAATVFYKSDPTDSSMKTIAGMKSAQTAYFGHWPFFGPYAQIGDRLWSGNPWCALASGPGARMNLARPDGGPQDDSDPFRAELYLEPLASGRNVVAVSRHAIWRIDLN